MLPAEILRCFHLLPVLFFLLLTSQPAPCQEISRADYDRAVSFLWENIENKTAFNLFVTANWFPDSTGLWYVTHDQGGKTYHKILTPSFKKSLLFNHEKLAETLAKRLDESVEARDLPIQNTEYADAKTIRFTAKGKRYALNLDDYQLQPLPEEPEEEELQSKSPDGKWIAFSKNYNLYLRSTETGEEFQLSTRGEKNFEYGSGYGWFDKMEGENGERPANFAVNWSPNSKWMQTQICDLRYANKMYLLDWSVDSLYRPRLLSYYRGSPGDTTMVHLIPLFYDVATKAEVRPDLPRNTHINSVSFQWSEKPAKVFVSYAERGYQKHYVKVLDLKANALRTLITETSNTNIDNFDYWPVEKQGKLIFTSERSGWKQIYACDLASGNTTAVTSGEFYINSIEYIDKETGDLYFLASGKEADCNPYHQFLYKSSLDGKKMVLLTPEKAHHQISFSPDGRCIMDNYSTATAPTRTALREAASGKILAEIAKADITALIAKNWSPPQIFEAVGRDRKTPIYGALWKPTHFDPAKKYPVIDHSYTGPHTQVFPKHFQQVLAVNNQALAELGFIVIMVDGMGSAGRSKAFHDVSYKNMGKNLEDHVLAIQQLSERYPWIDAERVGIFGHSAGGYDAGHAVLQFPDFYKVAVASSADHDFRMEKAWWPEMYMGWPVDSTYEQVSNITMAPHLKGKLLLVHGGLDDNVNPSATFKLAEALIKADKEFDLLIIPSQRHGYQEAYAKYFLKKRWNYFVEHLLGAAPVWDFAWE